VRGLSPSNAFQTVCLVECRIQDLAGAEAEIWDGWVHRMGGGQVGALVHARVYYPG
jgi:hypothetical protein